MIRVLGAAFMGLPSILPLQATAQEDGEGLALAFSLGGGVGSSPSYFGSDKAEPGPEIAFGFGGVRLGRFSFGDAGPEEIQDGFGLRGSFRYVSARSSGDYEELEGLDHVDAALEVGGGVSYARTWWEVFAVGRYAIGGHESLVGELGMDLIARPSERLTMRAGPRILVGSDDYAETYFGVSAEEAVASNFDIFDPSGEVLSSGLDVAAAYELTNAWTLEGNVRLETLQNDAAESPISAEDSQTSVSVAVTRRFNLGF